MYGAHVHPAHEQDTLRASFGVRLLAPFSRPLSRLSRLTGVFEDRASRRTHSPTWCSSHGSLASDRKRSPGSTPCSSSPSTWARRATRSPPLLYLRHLHLPL